MRKLFCACCFLLSAAFLCAVAADPKFPKLVGPVVDEADLLSPEQERRLTDTLTSLETRSSDQIAVVTLPSLQGFSIEEFGYKLGRSWGLGQAGKDNGVLLLVAPTERKVRIEVGKRLEPLLTDAMSMLIINNAILPAIRRGDFGGGIEAGVRDIQDVLLGDLEAVQKRAQGRGQAEENDTLATILMLLWFAVFIYVLWHQNRYWAQRSWPLDPRKRRRFHDAPIVFPGGWGHWNGGGGRGRGWSGGGGSFSGGGATGSW